ncbi:MAG: FHA domain-containing protein [Lachnospiraceae bacterium]|nr:FHA domain-containing protein [Lachnospiraceae bacterium]
MATNFINIAIILTIMIGTLTVGFLLWKLFQLNKSAKTDYGARSIFHQQNNSDKMKRCRTYSSVSEDKSDAFELLDGNRTVTFPGATGPFYKEEPIEPKTAIMYPGSTGEKVFARLKFVKIGDLPSNRVEFLIKRETTLGRSLKEDIALNDKYISGHHVVFLFDGTVLKLMDVGSTNGTFLNGRKIKENLPFVISSKSTIVMGATSFVVEKL